VYSFKLFLTVVLFVYVLAHLHVYVFHCYIRLRHKGFLMRHSRIDMLPVLNHALFEIDTKKYT
jgi:hypothetical protein